MLSSIHSNRKTNDLFLSVNTTIVRLSSSSWSAVAFILGNNRKTNKTCKFGAAHYWTMSLPSLSSSFITIVILIYSFVITVVILIYFFVITVVILIHVIVITIVILIHVIVILEIVSFFTKEPIHSKCNQCWCEWILKSAKVHSLQIFIQRAAFSAAGSSSLPRISSPSSQGNYKQIAMLCSFSFVMEHNKWKSKFRWVKEDNQLGNHPRTLLLLCVLLVDASCWYF